MKKNNKKIHWKNIVRLLLIIVAVFLAVWIVGSYIDTIFHNMPFRDGYGDFSKWNLFGGH